MELSKVNGWQTKVAVVQKTEEWQSSNKHKAYNAFAFF